MYAYELFLMGAYITNYMVYTFLQSFQHMMGQSTLVAALLISTLSYCSAENVYCVTPTTTSCSSCPHSSTNCTTLSEYAQEAELYFTSNTTMVFLPGDHVLDTNITVANVAGLTMCGESSSGNGATIVCSGSVGLLFTSMVDFKIDSLAFTSCSREYVTPPSFLPMPTANNVHAALLLQSTQYAELANCSFHHNIGTALVVNNTNITLADMNFAQNYVYCIGDDNLGGGGITAFCSNLTFTGNTTFLENKAYCGALDYGVSGGAIFAYGNTVLSFNGASSFMNNSGTIGGAIYISGNTAVLSFNGTNNFINNEAYFYYGGAIQARNGSLNFNGTSNFINNLAALHGGAISTHHTVLNFTGTSKFIGNSAGDNGGAIIIDANSTLTFSGTIDFTNNRRYGGGVFNIYTCGGGLYMGFRSTLSILPNTTVYLENNNATRGGAICVADASPISYCAPLALYIPKEECFFQLPGQNLSNDVDVQLVFKNNSADIAGSVLYGGAVDNCKLTGQDSHGSGEVFDMLVHIEDDNTTSSISSEPFRICPCVNHHPDCSKSATEHFTVYPGDTFTVSVVAVGQRNGTVPAVVRSTINNGKLLDSQYRQQANTICTTLSYTVHSLEATKLELIADGPCSTFGDKLSITFTMYYHCPPGFKISESARACVCEPRLVHYTHQCNITNGVGQLTRGSDQQFWVGYDDHSHGLILHPHCPLDYCVSYTVVFPLNNTDLQCADNRSGLLCGACMKGYSLVLGTSHCRQCTNSHLVLLIPFAVMGVALVFLLLVCKLTVATGTLSGLVFYANIVGVNRTIFLPVESTDGLSVFIAWLNLDFGIETCFFDGMDAYSKTWLQFVFPVYIWVLVGLMIFVSNYSRRFARLLGNNPVSVLATLILLSYTKILRTLITVFYVTYLEYPTHNRRVWLYNANIDYLSGIHIPLFLVAVLVFLFLFLPYTLLLLFGQWLQVISHLRLFSWVKSARLKPFMDSYNAPYKAKHRYWPGLLLVVRFVLLLVFALNPQQDPSVSLLAIVVGAGILHIWTWVSGGVYRNWCLDVLEGSYTLNLIVLSATTMIYHVSCSGGNQLAVGYTSVSITFATFIGILAFQLANVTGTTRYLKRKCMALKVSKIIQNKTEPKSPTGSLPDRFINPEMYEPPLPAPQIHITEPTDEAQRRLIPAYTYGSIN